jgi:N-acetylmuramoyl-L-alanine amidase
MRWWQNLPVVALLPLLPVLAAPNSGLIQVTGIRSWSHPDSVRVIIQTTGPFEYRADHAVNPDRLFFDILHARPLIDTHRFATRDIGGSLVYRVRIAETVPGTTRIVFDLYRPADFSVTRLDDPYRMVIEFRPRRSGVLPTGPVISSLPVLRGNRVPFTYPVSAPTPRPQIVFAGVAPSLPVPPPIVPFYFADPVTTLAQALPMKPARLSAAISTRGVPSSRAAASPIARTAPARIATSTPLSSVIPSTSVPTTIPAPAIPGPSIPATTAPAISATAPLAATASENAARSLTRALGLKVNRIVIDAGHGGHDDGTIGPHGVLEKDVVLDVALRLGKLVQERLNAEVVFTRADDTFIPLHERTAIANEHKADLFLSIHANSSPAPEVAGTETFFLNFTNAPDALNVAARENAGSEKSVGELRDLIQTITMNDKIEESHTFAQEIQTSIQTQAARSNPAAHNRGVKRAPFVVLIGASMPSVLAEIGFLSNSRDESNLNKPEYRQKVAEALFKGLAQYAGSLSHFEPARQIAKSAP